jgi:hypothetical protein
VRQQVVLRVGPVVDLLAGDTSVCPGVMGPIVRKATAVSSAQTKRPGMSPAMIEEKRVGMATSVAQVHQPISDAAVGSGRMAGRVRRVAVPLS